MGRKPRLPAPCPFHPVPYGYLPIETVVNSNMADGIWWREMPCETTAKQRAKRRRSNGGRGTVGHVFGGGFLLCVYAFEVTFWKRILVVRLCFCVHSSGYDSTSFGPCTTLTRIEQHETRKRDGGGADLGVSIVAVEDSEEHDGDGIVQNLPK